jgi:Rrf2 family transcriptional regulator, iron-sulfur cluster assembly transcription factor
MFSKACEYGIKASIYIAEQSLVGRKVGLKEISDTIESPSAYTSKILQNLSRSFIINSDKGPTGGFSMDTDKMEKIKLSTIVFAIDGDSIYNGCGLGLKKCNEKMPCPVHDQFKIVRDELKKMLDTTTIKTLAVNLDKKLTFLKR